MWLLTIQEQLQYSRCVKVLQHSRPVLLHYSRQLLCLSMMTFIVKIHRLLLSAYIIHSTNSRVTIVRLTLKVLVTTIDAQWEGIRDVGLARYEPALLPPCPTIRVLSYSD